MFTNHKLIPNYRYNSTGLKSVPFHHTLGRRVIAKAEPPYVREEADEELNELADQYYRYYRPVSPDQRDRIDSMVENEWRLRGAALDDQEAECAANEESENFLYG
jgi:hypothetical protein